MRIVVVGAGSVGLLLAARLQLGGANVQLITRSRGQAVQLRNHGITLHTLGGDVTRLAIDTATDSERWPEAEIYLLAVKQPDITSILPSLRLIPQKARVIALQNGIGHEELLCQAVLPEQLFFGVNTEGARRLTVSEVSHTGVGLLRIGPWNKQDHPDQLLHSFIIQATACGIPAQYVEATSGYIWRKVIANSVINPLTALFEVPNGWLLDVPNVVVTMRHLFDEAAAVAAFYGQKIDDKDWQDLLTICRNTFQNHSSMLQDLRLGRPTEIEAINGYLVKAGMEHGIETPYQKAVREAILLKTGIRLKKGGA